MLWKRFLLFSVVILIVSCASTKYVCPDGSTVADRANCPSTVTNTSEVQDSDTVQNTTDERGKAERSNGTVQTPSSYSIDNRSKALIQKGMRNARNIKYVYSDNRYQVFGKRMKIALAQATNYKQTQPFSHVYINLQSGEAIGVCEAEDTSWCPNRTTHDADVSDYYTRTPLDWLQVIKGASYQGSGMQLQQRSTHQIAFTTGSVNGTMYLLDYYYVPAKIELQERTISYRDISVGTVDKADVTR